MRGTSSAEQQAAGGEDGPSADTVKGAPFSSPRAGVTLMASAFFAIFFSFSTAQNFQTSRGSGNVGNRTLAILYASFSLSNLVSSSFLRRFGAKSCLVVASVGYAAFDLVQIWPRTALLYASAGALGVLSAVLWNAQAKYVTAAAERVEEDERLPAKSVRGRMNGRFFSVFSLNLFAGSLFAAVLFQANASERTVFAVLTGVSLLGTGALLLLPRFGDEPAGDGVLAETAAVLRLVARPDFLRCLPAVFGNGMMSAVMFGEFPPLVEDRATRFYVLAGLGLALGGGSFVFGKMGDRVGHARVLALGTVILAVPLVWLAADHAARGAATARARDDGAEGQGAAEVATLGAAGVLLGLGYAVFQTELHAVIGLLFPGETATAFATYKLVQSSSVAASFAAAPYLSLSAKLFAAAAAVLLGTAALLWSGVQLGGGAQEEEKTAAVKPVVLSER